MQWKPNTLSFYSGSSIQLAHKFLLSLRKMARIPRDEKLTHQIRLTSLLNL